MSTMSISDDREIHAVVQRLVDAWRQGDADAFAGAFAADADFFNVFAQRLCGRAAIASHHAQLFVSVYRGTRVTDVQVSIKSAAPNAAVVSWSSVLHVAGEQRRGHALSVFVRAGGSWEIVSLQNMAPLSPPV
jgi:uncharacterized protein (TIGR02246 family)